MTTILLTQPDEFAFTIGLIESPCRLFPESIQNELSQYSGTDLVAWAEPKNRLFGIAQGKHSLCFRKKKVRALVISHQLPAKGSGGVSLDANLFGATRFVTLVKTDIFYEDHLLWLRSNRKALEQLFGLVIREADSGYDC